MDCHQKKDITEEVTIDSTIKGTELDKKDALSSEPVDTDSKIQIPSTKESEIQEDIDVLHIDDKKVSEKDITEEETIDSSIKETELNKKDELLSKAVDIDIKIQIPSTKESEIQEDIDVLHINDKKVSETDITEVETIDSSIKGTELDKKDEVVSEAVDTVSKIQIPSIKENEIQEEIDVLQKDDKKVSEKYITEEETTDTSVKETNLNKKDELASEAVDTDPQIQIPSTKENDKKVSEKDITEKETIDSSIKRTELDKKDDLISEPVDTDIKIKIPSTKESEIQEEINVLHIDDKKTSEKDITEEETIDSSIKEAELNEKDELVSEPVHTDIKIQIPSTKENNEKMLSEKHITEEETIHTSVEETELNKKDELVSEAVDTDSKIQIPSTKESEIQEEIDIVQMDDKKVSEKHIIEEETIDTSVKETDLNIKDELVSEAVDTVSKIQICSPKESDIQEEIDVLHKDDKKVSEKDITEEKTTDTSVKETDLNKKGELVLEAVDTDPQIQIPSTQESEIKEEIDVLPINDKKISEEDIINEQTIETSIKETELNKKDELVSETVDTDPQIQIPSTKESKIKEKIDVLPLNDKKISEEDIINEETIDSSIKETELNKKDEVVSKPVDTDIKNQIPSTKESEIQEKIDVLHIDDKKVLEKDITEEETIDSSIKETELNNKDKLVSEAIDIDSKIQIPSTKESEIQEEIDVLQIDDKNVSEKDITEEETIDSSIKRTELNKKDALSSEPVDTDIKIQIPSTKESEIQEEIDVLHKDDKKVSEKDITEEETIDSSIKETELNKKNELVSEAVDTDSKIKIPSTKESEIPKEIDVLHIDDKEVSEKDINEVETIDSSIKETNLNNKDELVSQTVDTVSKIQIPSIKENEIQEKIDVLQIDDKKVSEKHITEEETINTSVKETDLNKKDELVSEAVDTGRPIQILSTKESEIKEEIDVLPINDKKISEEDIINEETIETSIKETELNKKDELVSKAVDTDRQIKIPSTKQSEIQEEIDILLKDDKKVSEKDITEKETIDSSIKGTELGKIDALSSEDIDIDTKIQIPSTKESEIQKEINVLHIDDKKVSEKDITKEETIDSSIKETKLNEKDELVSEPVHTDIKIQIPSTKESEIQEEIDVLHIDDKKTSEKDIAEKETIDFSIKGTELYKKDALSSKVIDIDIKIQIPSTKESEIQEEINVLLIDEKKISEQNITEKETIDSSIKGTELDKKDAVSSEDIDIDTKIQIPSSKDSEIQEKIDVLHKDDKKVSEKVITEEETIDSSIKETKLNKKDELVSEPVDTDIKIQIPSTNESEIQEEIDVLHKDDKKVSEKDITEEETIDSSIKETELNEKDELVTEPVHTDIKIQIPSTKESEIQEEINVLHIDDKKVSEQNITGVETIDSSIKETELSNEDELVSQAVDTDTKIQIPSPKESKIQQEIDAVQIDNKKLSEKDITEQETKDTFIKGTELHKKDELISEAVDTDSEIQISSAKESEIQKEIDVLQIDDKKVSETDITEEETKETSVKDTELNKKDELISEADDTVSEVQIPSTKEIKIQEEIDFLQIDDKKVSEKDITEEKTIETSIKETELNKKGELISETVDFDSKIQIPSIKESEIQEEIDVLHIDDKKTSEKDITEKETIDSSIKETELNKKDELVSEAVDTDSKIQIPSTKDSEIQEEIDVHHIDHKKVSEKDIAEKETIDSSIKETELNNLDELVSEAVDTDSKIQIPSTKESEIQEDIDVVYIDDKKVSEKDITEQETKDTFIKGTELHKKDELISEAVDTDSKIQISSSKESEIQEEIDDLQIDDKNVSEKDITEEETKETSVKDTELNKKDELVSKAVDTDSKIQIPSTKEIKIQEEIDFLQLDDKKVSEKDITEEKTIETSIKETELNKKGELIPETVDTGSKIQISSTKESEIQEEIDVLQIDDKNVSEKYITEEETKETSVKDTELNKKDELISEADDTVSKIQIPSTKEIEIQEEIDFLQIDDKKVSEKDIAEKETIETSIKVTELNKKDELVSEPVHTDIKIQIPSTKEREIQEEIDVLHKDDKKVSEKDITEEETIDSSIKETELNEKDELVSEPVHTDIKIQIPSTKESEIQEEINVLHIDDKKVSEQNITGVETIDSSIKETELSNEDELVSQAVDTDSKIQIPSPKESKIQQEIDAVQIDNKKLSEKDITEQETKDTFIKGTELHKKDELISEAVDTDSKIQISSSKESEIQKEIDVLQIDDKKVSETDITEEETKETSVKDTELNKKDELISEADDTVSEVQIPSTKEIKIQEEIDFLQIDDKKVSEKDITEEKTIETSIKETELNKKDELLSETVVTDSEFQISSAKESEIQEEIDDLQINYKNVSEKDITEEETKETSVKDTELNKKDELVSKAVDTDSKIQIPSTKESEIQKDIDVLQIDDKKVSEKDITEKETIETSIKETELNKKDELISETVDTDSKIQISSTKESEIQDEIDVLQIDDKNVSEKDITEEETIDSSIKETELTEKEELVSEAVDTDSKIQIVTTRESEIQEEINVLQRNDQKLSEKDITEEETIETSIKETEMNKKDELISEAVVTDSKCQIPSPKESKIQEKIDVLQINDKKSTEKDNTENKIINSGIKGSELDEKVALLSQAVDSDIKIQIPFANDNAPIKEIDVLETDDKKGSEKDITEEKTIDFSVQESELDKQDTFVSEAILTDITAKETIDFSIKGTELDKKDALPSEAIDTDNKIQIPSAKENEIQEEIEILQIDDKKVSEKDITKKGTIDSSIKEAEMDKKDALVSEAVDTDAQISSANEIEVHGKIDVLEKEEKIISEKGIPEKERIDSSIPEIELDKKDTLASEAADNDAQIQIPSANENEIQEEIDILEKIDEKLSEKDNIEKERIYSSIQKTEMEEKVSFQSEEVTSNAKIETPSIKEIKSQEEIGVIQYDEGKVSEKDYTEKETIDSSIKEKELDKKDTLESEEVTTDAKIQIPSTKDNEVKQQTGVLEKEDKQLSEKDFTQKNTIDSSIKGKELDKKDTLESEAVTIDAKVQTPSAKEIEVKQQIDSSIQETQFDKKDTLVSEAGETDNKIQIHSSREIEIKGEIDVPEKDDKNVSEKCITEKETVDSSIPETELYKKDTLVSEGVDTNSKIQVLSAKDNEVKQEIDVLEKDDDKISEIDYTEKETIDSSVKEKELDKQDTFESEAILTDSKYVVPYAKDDEVKDKFDLLQKKDKKVLEKDIPEKETIDSFVKENEMDKEDTLISETVDSVSKIQIPSAKEIQIKEQIDVLQKDHEKVSEKDIPEKETIDSFVKENEMDKEDTLISETVDSLSKIQIPSAKEIQIKEQIDVLQKEDEKVSEKDITEKETKNSFIQETELDKKDTLVSDTVETESKSKIPSAKDNEVNQEIYIFEKNDEKLSEKDITEIATTVSSIKEKDMDKGNSMISEEVDIYCKYQIPSVKGIEIKEKIEVLDKDDEKISEIEITQQKTIDSSIKDRELYKNDTLESEELNTDSKIQAPFAKDIEIKKEIDLIQKVDKKVSEKHFTEKEPLFSSIPEIELDKKDIVESEAVDLDTKIQVPSAKDDEVKQEIDILEKDDEKVLEKDIIEKETIDSFMKEKEMNKEDSMISERVDTDFNIQITSAKEIQIKEEIYSLRIDDEMVSEKVKIDSSIQKPQLDIKDTSVLEVVDTDRNIQTLYAKDNEIKEKIDVLEKNDEKISDKEMNQKKTLDSSIQDTELDRKDILESEEFNTDIKIQTSCEMDIEIKEKIEVHQRDDKKVSEEDKTEKETIDSSIQATELDKKDSLVSEAVDTDCEIQTPFAEVIEIKEKIDVLQKLDEKCTKNYITEKKTIDTFINEVDMDKKDIIMTETININSKTLSEKNIEIKEEINVLDKDDEKLSEKDITEKDMIDSSIKATEMDKKEKTMSEPIYSKVQIPTVKDIEIKEEFDIVEKNDEKLSENYISKTQLISVEDIEEHDKILLEKDMAVTEIKTISIQEKDIVEKNIKESEDVAIDSKIQIPFRKDSEVKKEIDGLEKEDKKVSEKFISVTETEVSSSQESQIASIIDVLNKTEVVIEEKNKNNSEKDNTETETKAISIQKMDSDKQQDMNQVMTQSRTQILSSDDADKKEIYVLHKEAEKSITILESQFPTVEEVAEKTETCMIKKEDETVSMNDIIEKETKAPLIPETKMDHQEDVTDSEELKTDVSLTKPRFQSADDIVNKTEIDHKDHLTQKNEAEKYFTADIKETDVIKQEEKDSFDTEIQLLLDTEVENLQCIKDSEKEFPNVENHQVSEKYVTVQKESNIIEEEHKKFSEKDIIEPEMDKQQPIQESEKDDTETEIPSSKDIADKIKGETMTHPPEESEIDQTKEVLETQQEIFVEEYQLSLAKNIQDNENFDVVQQEHEKLSEKNITEPNTNIPSDKDNVDVIDYSEDKKDADIKLSSESKFERFEKMAQSVEVNTKVGDVSVEFEHQFIKTDSLVKKHADISKESIKEIIIRQIEETSVEKDSKSTEISIIDKKKDTKEKIKEIVEIKSTSEQVLVCKKIEDKEESKQDVMDIESQESLIQKINESVVDQSEFSDTNKQKVQVETKIEVTECLNQSIISVTEEKHSEIKSESISYVTEEKDFDVPVDSVNDQNEDKLESKTTTADDKETEEISLTEEKPSTQISEHLVETETSKCISKDFTVRTPEITLTREEIQGQLSRENETLSESVIFSSGYKAYGTDNKTQEELDICINSSTKTPIVKETFTKESKLDYLLKKDESIITEEIVESSEYHKTEMAIKKLEEKATIIASQVEDFSNQMNKENASFSKQTFIDDKLIDETVNNIVSSEKIKNIILHDESVQVSKNSEDKEDPDVLQDNEKSNSPIKQAGKGGQDQKESINNDLDTYFEDMSLPPADIKTSTEKRTISSIEEDELKGKEVGTKITLLEENKPLQEVSEAVSAEKSSDHRKESESVLEDNKAMTKSDIAAEVSIETNQTISEISQKKERSMESNIIEKEIEMLDSEKTTEQKENQQGKAIDMDTLVQEDHELKDKAESDNIIIVESKEISEATKLCNNEKLEISQIHMTSKKFYNFIEEKLLDVCKYNEPTKKDDDTRTSDAENMDDNTKELLEHVVSKLEDKQFIDTQMKSVKETKLSTEEALKSKEEINTIKQSSFSIACEESHIEIKDVQIVETSSQIFDSSTTVREHTILDSCIVSEEKDKDSSKTNTDEVLKSKDIEKNKMNVSIAVQKDTIKEVDVVDITSDKDNIQISIKGSLESEPIDLKFNNDYLKDHNVEIIEEEEIENLPGGESLVTFEIKETIISSEGEINVSEYTTDSKNLSISTVEENTPFDLEYEITEGESQIAVDSEDGNEENFKSGDRNIEKESSEKYLCEPDSTVDYPSLEFIPLSQKEKDSIEQKETSSQMDDDISDQDSSDHHSISASETIIEEKTGQVQKETLRDNDEKLETLSVNKQNLDQPDIPEVTETILRTVESKKTTRSKEVSPVREPICIERIIPILGEALVSVATSSREKLVGKTIEAPKIPENILKCETKKIREDLTTKENEDKDKGFLSKKNQKEKIDQIINEHTIDQTVNKNEEQISVSDEPIVERCTNELINENVPSKPYQKERIIEEPSFEECTEQDGIDCEEITLLPEITPESESKNFDKDSLDSKSIESTCTVHQECSSISFTQEISMQSTTNSSETENKDTAKSIKDRILRSDFDDESGDICSTDESFKATFTHTFDDEEDSKEEQFSQYYSQDGQRMTERVVVTMDQNSSSKKTDEELVIYDKVIDAPIENNKFEPRSADEDLQLFEDLSSTEVYKTKVEASLEDIVDSKDSIKEIRGEESEENDEDLADEGVLASTLSDPMTTSMYISQEYPEDEEEMSFETVLIIVKRLEYILRKTELILVDESSAIICEELPDENMLKSIAISIDEIHKLVEKCQSFYEHKTTKLDFKDYVHIMTRSVESLVIKSKHDAQILINRNVSCTEKLKEDLSRANELLVQCKNIEIDDEEEEIEEETKLIKTPPPSPHPEKESSFSEYVYKAENESTSSEVNRNIESYTETKTEETSTFSSSTLLKHHTTITHDVRDFQASGIYGFEETIVSPRSCIVKQQPFNRSQSVCVESTFPCKASAIRSFSITSSDVSEREIPSTSPRDFSQSLESTGMMPAIYEDYECHYTSMIAHIVSCPRRGIPRSEEMERICDVFLEDQNTEPESSSFPTKIHSEKPFPTAISCIAEDLKGDKIKQQIIQTGESISETISDVCTMLKSGENTDTVLQSNTFKTTVSTSPIPRGAAAFISHADNVSQSPSPQPLPSSSANSTPTKKKIDLKTTVVTKTITTKTVMDSDGNVIEEITEESEDTSNEIEGQLAKWGKPMRLPSPIRPNNSPPPPERERKSNKKSDHSRATTSSSPPVYMDLAYVPHHGDSQYSNVEFFMRVRARYYVFSGVEPSREVFNALLEAKQKWEDKNLEVTIIPTYDSDALGYWVAENEEALIENKIDLAPSASRCTINLQDHETSCAAYRLEF
ncbi:LOW QUALITY PROTEIN: uncharacterized protein [Lepeophtheirus salmonis]|uniref:LOW QUALITY PROTEIN: uncharacterized protein n=1 Tax=Lepeophtheirus salmonis TaxID=72036 RepID=UPI003AF3771B